MDEIIRNKLEQLPHRAIVAFALRCAQRVQPLTRNLAKYERHSVDRAIQWAEGCARNRVISPEPGTSAEGAAIVADDAALAAEDVGDSAAQAAAQAAAAAARAAANTVNVPRESAAA